MKPIINILTGYSLIVIGVALLMIYANGTNDYIISGGCILVVAYLLSEIFGKDEMIFFAMISASVLSGVWLIKEIYHFLMNVHINLSFGWTIVGIITMAIVLGILAHEKEKKQLKNS